MRISFHAAVVALLLACAAVTLASEKADKRNSSKKERHLRSNQRNLQYFPYLKTSSIAPEQTVEEESEVVTVVSALATIPSGEEEVVELTRNTPIEDDLGYRFNKMQMLDSSVEMPILSADDYPLSEDMSERLRYETNAFSVVDESDIRMKGRNVKYYIEKCGGLPSMPTRNSSDPYWQEFKRVVKRSRERQLGRLPPSGAFRAPRLWENKNATEVAECVHDEYPGKHQAKMIESFILSDEGIQLDHNIVPFRCQVDFIGTEVRLAALNTWSITTVAPFNFAAKWYVGRMRPEEMAWKYINREIPPKYIPRYARRLLRRMNIKKATDFSHYPEGCPLHPSWPAMHSAASSSSLWLAVVANLTDDQYCQVLRTDHSVAYARTVAGVHYESDNIAGLNMGQEVIANSLPEHLAEMYGADPDAVRAKIARLRFDWNTYSPRHCTVEYSTVEPRAAVDMGLRFNKFTMAPEYDGPEVLLKAPDYPLQDEMAHTLSYESDAFSVVTTKDIEMEGHDVLHYIEAVGMPDRPSADPDAPFWAEFREVVERQLERLNGQLPPASILTLPKLWEQYNVTEVCEAVHDEYPGTNQANMIESFILERGRTGIKLDHEILPFRCVEDFIGTEVRLAALNTWAIAKVGPINFCAKWYVGQPRPEEIAWKIANDEIPKEQVPEDIYDAIKSMNIASATSFTQYPEGSPNHPSWPAMHSASSSASLWLAVIADLTDEQYCQVLRTDHAVSYARTVAGVHYRSDNVAGLNMGQNVIAHALPEHLAEMYGADPDAVRAKIARLRFDWATYSPENCSVVYGVRDDKA